MKNLPRGPGRCRRGLDLHRIKMRIKRKNKYARSRHVSRTVISALLNSPRPRHTLDRWKSIESFAVEKELMVFVVCRSCRRRDEPGVVGKKKEARWWWSRYFSGFLRIPTWLWSKIQTISKMARKKPLHTETACKKQPFADVYTCPMHDQ